MTKHIKKIKTNYTDSLPFKRPRTITRMNDNISMDSTIAWSMNDRLIDWKVEYVG